MRLDRKEYLSVSEPQRLALHAAARATLGDEEGDTLMALTPPANTEIATRQDLERIGERLDTRIVSLGQRMDGLEERLDGKMNSLEERLNFRMESLEARLDGKMNSLEERLNFRMDSLEERLDARIAAAVSGVREDLTKSLHRAELRMMSVIVLAFLGTNFLG